jgi:CheY-like chemotaxis protein
LTVPDPAPDPTPPATAAGAGDATAACRVLVVDDNETVVRALSKLIGREGFHAIPCCSGQDAIAFAEQHDAPAAAVVDVHLPDINGLVLAHKLRTLFGPSTPIIVVSGDTSMETLKSLSHVGAAYFFPKPLNPAVLVERLKELTTPGENRAAG